MPTPTTLGKRHEAASTDRGDELPGVRAIVETLETAASIPVVAWTATPDPAPILAAPNTPRFKGLGLNLEQWTAVAELIEAHNAELAEIRARIEALPAMTPA